MACALASYELKERQAIMTLAVDERPESASRPTTVHSALKRARRSTESSSSCLMSYTQLDVIYPAPLCFICSVSLRAYYALC